MNPAWLAVPVAAGVVGTAFGVAHRIVHTLNAPPEPTYRDAYTFSPYEANVECEHVSFRTEDNLILRGWFLPHDKSDRVVIGLSGHKGGKHDLLGIGSGLWRAGYNVLLFDYRGCGESDRAPLSLGYHELSDARAAVGYVRERLPHAHIGLVGYSMGAAIAIITAAGDPTIRAVVADSSFSSVRDVVADAVRAHALPPRPFVYLSDLWNQRVEGYPFNAVEPAAALGRITPRPVLVVHGTEDSIVPVSHAYRLKAGAGEGTTLWIVPGVEHCGAYFLDRPAYVRRVADFFAPALGPIGPLIRQGPQEHESYP
jgi:pimeloyl-ACP methyl ester carboxylesterase